MSTHKFNHAVEFVGPGASTIDGHLEIEFEHHKADPNVGAPEGITIENILVDMGDVTYEFNGDYHDDHLVTLCWEHLKDKQERIECERADMQRDERGAQ